MSRLLNSQEVLKELGLSKEVSPGVWKGNDDIITSLVQRNILPRIEYGPRTFRYELEDVLEVIEKVKRREVKLIERSFKKAA